MATIYLTERQVKVLQESNEEVTFYEFFTEVKNYLKELLLNPINAEPSPMFAKHGISKTKLLDKLIERGIVNKTETIDEPTDSKGKMFSMYHVKYSIPRKNFEQKIHRLYSYFFER